MKVKYLFIAIISVLMIISISQIFSIYPYAEDILPSYKSGYFRELDRKCAVIRDSFISIKSMSKPVYGWIFLDDIKTAQAISVNVYDRAGFHIPLPGEKSSVPGNDIVKFLSENGSDLSSRVHNGKYYTIMAVKYEKKCYYCHDHGKNTEIAGVMTFEQDFDAHIYYSLERIIIFLVISIILAGVLFLLVRWEPVRNIKEMFDKS